MAKAIHTKQNELSLLAGSLFPSFVLLRRNDPLRMAGATAFFTTFALPPIVFILAQLFGLFLEPKIIGRGLIQNISNNLGREGAQQIRDVITSIRGFNQSWYIIVLGSVFLLFVATTLFVVIKDSFNQIWQIAVKPHPGLGFRLITRLRSFAVIIAVGILFFANLIFQSIETAGGKYFDEMVHGSSIYFKLCFSEITSVIIVTVWFTILFKFLADGTPRWKAAFAGGLLCGILFTAGRVLLKFILTGGNIGHLYGPSGSMVLVLLFVFYTSFIMYFGASFIAVYSEKKDLKIKHDRQSYQTATSV